MIEESIYVKNHIADELSEKVYSKRIQYLNNRTEENLEALLHLCWDGIKNDKDVIGFYNKLKQIQSKIFLFGCGNYSNLCIYLCPDILWTLIDNYYEFHEFNSYPVMSFSEFRESGISGEDYVVLASKKYFDEMFKQLKDVGISAEKIIDATFLFDLIEGKQYFDLKYMSYAPSGEEIFIDGGGFDGVSSLNFIEWCNGTYNKIICFEPDSINVCKIERNTHCIERFELVKKGLWDKETKLSFMTFGNGMSKIVENTNNTCNNLDIVPVTSIDLIARGMKVTFIKMDIEGSELKALEGAKETIRLNRPKLAICIYHKIEDMWTIPEFVLSIHPDYKLYFRHYGFTDSETVMYAI